MHQLLNAVEKYAAEGVDVKIAIKRFENEMFQLNLQQNFLLQNLSLTSEKIWSGVKLRCCTR